MIRRKTKTTIEVRQVYVIRQPDTRAPAFCSECTTADALMGTPDEAAAVAEVSARQVYRLVEAGLVHYVESEDGAVFVCLNSMAMTINHPLPN